jgi:DNA-binding ferritin-like protein (Dps family)/putative flippase GtrA
MNKKTKLLLKENNKFEDNNLSEHSKNVITDIVCYLRGSDLSEYNQEVVRRDIDYMLFDGETRGETAELVVGRDYQAFCDEIVKSFPKRTTAEKIISNINDITSAISVIALIWLFIKVTQSIVEGNSIFHLQITLGEIIGNIIAVIEAKVIFNYITRKTFDVANMKENRMKYFFQSWLKLTLLVIIPVCFYISLKSPSFPIVMPVAVCIILIPLLIGYILDKVE